MLVKNRQHIKRTSGVSREAKELRSDPAFLYRVIRKIGELGVVGEEPLRAIVYLAGVTRSLPDKASVLIKGSTSSGKSRTMKTVLRMFPPNSIIERAGLSKKALAYGQIKLKDKILVMTEYQSGKEAQFFIRMLQSEGGIEHEATMVTGARRKTKTVKRVGSPVVITTTTSDKVYDDDETRFLSVHVTESPEQTLAILKSQIKDKPSSDNADLKVWQKATSMLLPKLGDFRAPPMWLEYVVERLPLDEVRLRRDWKRFLTFLRAIALCRPRPSDGTPLDITFADYCVGYKIFEQVFRESIREVPPKQLQIRRTIETLTREHGEAVTVRDLASHLRWEKALVYKLLKGAIKNGLVGYEAGTRQKNVKRLLARAAATTQFLPSPKDVLVNNPKIGKKCKFVHPFTGKWRAIYR